LPINGKPNIDGDACRPTNSCPAGPDKVAEEAVAAAAVQRKAVVGAARKAEGTVGP